MVESTKNVRGMSEIAAALKRFPLELKEKAMRGASRAAAMPIQNEARRLAPKNTGQYAEGITTRVTIKGEQVVATIATRGPHAFLGNWLEYTGAAPHDISPRKRGGKKALSLASTGFDDALFAKVHHPGIKPTPHMRPALDTQADAAVVAMGEYLRRWLKRKGVTGLDAVQVEGPAE